MNTNYFELFHLPQAYAVDLQQLDSAYRDVQSQVHPDRYALATEAERRVAMQWATLANEAYQALKKPLARAEYLLKLGGVDPELESNTSMPVDFLMAQMEWREELAEAVSSKSVSALSGLSSRLQSEMNAMLSRLGATIDQEQDLPAAALLVRKLKFLHKLDEEIENALDAIG